jgi:hypothetical protein
MYAKLGGLPIETKLWEELDTVVQNEIVDQYNFQHPGLLPLNREEINSIEETNRLQILRNIADKVHIRYF